MSKQLYEEALADVKKLKEIAEDNAKKALIEAVSPRIKDLIEAELLREVSDEEDELLLDDGLGPDGVAVIPTPAAADISGTDADVAAAMSLPDDEGKVTLDLDALAVQPAAAEEEYELSNESAELLNPLITKLDSAVKLKIESRLFQLGESIEKFLGAGKLLKKSTAFQQKILGMVSEVESLRGHLQKSAGNLHDKGVYEGKLEELKNKLNKLVEQDDMKKNSKSLLEGDVTLKLTGMPDELDLDSIGVDLITGEEGEEGGEEGGEEDLDLGGEEEAGGEEGGEEDLDLGDEEEKAEESQQMESQNLDDNTVVEIDESMLRREIASMRRLREAAEEVQAWGHGAGDVAGFGDDDLGEPLELDLSEVQDQDDDLAELDQMWELEDEEASSDEDDKEEMDELDQAMYQAVDRESGGSRSAGQSPSAGPGAGSSKRGRSPDTDVAEAQDQQDEAEEKEDSKKSPVQEIRGRLAREQKIQLEAKKKAGVAKKKQAEAKKKAKLKEQQAQASAKKGQKGDSKKAKADSVEESKKAQKLGEAYTYFATKFNESVRRTGKLQAMLVEANKRTEVRHNGTSEKSSEATTNLRKKLAETNLFNMKLLYSNKLLQNESLTKRQKAEVIERLDEANNEREVKLVYESLIKALSATSRPIAEGTQRVLGSSSQATRPASTVLSESYEADRWARLAGIK